MPLSKLQALKVNMRQTDKQTLRKTRGTKTELYIQRQENTGKKNKVFFESSGRFGCAVNMHREGGKKKKDQGAKASFPEKGVAGDAVQQVIRLSLGRLGQ